MVDLHCKAHGFDLLPEGLNELMGDISREVLRSQPKDIHGFIAQYLGALLDARKALSIAGDVCEDVRASCCEKKEHVMEDPSIDGSAISQPTNESLNTSSGSLTVDCKQNSGPANVHFEIEEYKCQQHRDFWSPSVFSLTGSYMNLPTTEVYSVYETIVDSSKTSKRYTDNSGNSDYILDKICIDDSSS